MNVMIAGFLLIVSSAVRVQAVPDTVRISCDTMTVTATRSAKRIRDVSATVSVLSREEIEAVHSNSCTDILGMLPGVYINKTGDFGRADIDIRGIGDRGRSIMVLVDGRPVKMGLYGCTVTHSLPLDNVERIEVVRGPASVLYGSDAMGGVVNIITRKASRAFESDVTASYGANNTQTYRARLGGIVNGFDYYLTGDKRSSDGFTDNSAYDGNDMTARLGYAVTEKSAATVTYKYFDGHKEEPKRVTDPDAMSSTTWNDYKRGAVDASYTMKAQKGEALAKVYYNYGDHEFSDGWDSEDNTIGAILNGSVKPVTGNTVTGGFEYRKQAGESFGLPAGKWDKYEYAVYLHDEQLFMDKLIATGGLRYNVDQVSGSVICPQAGLVYFPVNGTALRLAANKGFRSPQINELYIFPPKNEDLKAEEVWNYELGINQKIIKGLSADLTAFMMKGSNLVEKVSWPTPPPMFKFQNTGEFEFKGVEAALNGTFFTGLHSKLALSYLDPGEKTTGRPGFKTDLFLRYSWKKLEASLAGQYVTEYFAADSSQSPVDDYIVLNTKVSYSVLKGLKANLAVDNLLNTEYDVYANLPTSAGLYRMPGITVHAGLTYEFAAGEHK